MKLTKKGYGTIEFIQSGENCFIVRDGVRFPVTKEVGNQTYRQYLANGWHKPAETKKAAPSNRPKWHFPGGEFDREKYVETAETMGYSVWSCGDSKVVHTSKAGRQEIYLAMGAYYG